jgi:hypothetical protein
MAISGTAAWIMAGSALAGTGYAVYAGERGAKMQRQAVRRQQQAQKTAEQRALSQERRSMLETNRARSKKADVSTLLAAQETGGNPTMLTGPRGTSSMLGE